ncbi:alkaline phosphatase D-like isoform X1 [Zingiber officinale]|uniref:alkaline phosphatase D-like isoform X1 n=1 Tax=Zingiber officinale TaxID=94328 RepID=UPI001C4C32CB|nr:alkaline phosphatase D-like isoform X1 [Zingiber officinale]
MEMKSRGIRRSSLSPYLLFLVLLVSLSKASPSSSNGELPPPGVVSRIAFGSCSNQSAPQSIWDAVLDFDPQVFIWLGDNIYGDNKRPFRIMGKERTIGPWKNVPRFFPSTEEEMRRRYLLAKGNPGYSNLRQTAQVIGTWDDHDYGLNDAGKEFSKKEINQRLLLDFLDEAEDSPRRRQDGVYTSYIFGPSGKQIKIILLDTRYHRDPLFSDGTILGDSQWQWLENELYGPESEITIIASSIQVVSNLSAITSPLFYPESWGRFPKERKRLYKLVKDSKRSGIFFISGDVHFGEITRYDCGEQYPLYDITSSGLTQAIEKVVPKLFAFLVRAIAWWTPSTMRVYSSECRYRSCTYAQPNFGAIQIIWDEVPQRIRVEVRDSNGDPATAIDILLSDLQSIDTNKIIGRPMKYEHHCLLESELPCFWRHSFAFIVFASSAGLLLAMILLAYTIASASKKFLLKFKID